MNLCLKCERYNGKCSWSKDGKPIKGWVATEVELTTENTEEKFYVVSECPKFKPREEDYKHIEEEEQDGLF